MSWTRRTFRPDVNRYVFDFELCTYAKGWAQVDTYQDASYFGIWTQPWERRTVTFAEGDLDQEFCISDADYSSALLRCVLAYSDGTDRWPHAKIDPGIRTAFAMRDRLSQLGLVAYLH